MDLQKRIKHLSGQNSYLGIKTLIIIAGVGAMIVHIFTRDSISLILFCLSLSLSFPEAVLSIARKVNKNAADIEVLKYMLEDLKKTSPEKFWN